MLQAYSNSYYDKNKVITEVSTSKDRIYHNAKALLEIYSKTAWETSTRYSDIVYTYENDYGINDIKGLEIMVSLGEETEAKKLSDRLLSVCKNKLIIDAINSALLRLKDYPHIGEFMSEFGKYKGIDTLSRDILADLVDRILIGEDKSIRIEFKLLDEFR